MWYNIDKNILQSIQNSWKHHRLGYFRQLFVVRNLECVYHRSIQALSVLYNTVCVSYVPKCNKTRIELAKICPIVNLNFSSYLPLREDRKRYSKSTFDFPLVFRSRRVTSLLQLKSEVLKIKEVTKKVEIRRETFIHRELVLKQLTL